MAKLKVRTGQPADLDSLMAFNTAMAMETEQKTLDPKVLRSGISRLLLEPALGRYILAMQGTTIAGALMLTTEWSDWRNGLFWWIQSVYVLPELRRLGVYRALHEHVRSTARNTPDVCGIRLYVERENHAAQQTYRALGMHETVYRLYEEEF